MITKKEKKYFEKVKYEMREFRKRGANSRDVSLFLLGMCAMMDMSIEYCDAKISKGFYEKLYEYAEFEKDNWNNGIN